MRHNRSKHEKKTKKNVLRSVNLASKKELKSLVLLRSLLIPFFGTTIFAVQMAKTSFVLTSPSDPLQYVQPALDPSKGFEFLDRIFGLFITSPRDRKEFFLNSYHSTQISSKGSF